MHPLVLAMLLLAIAMIAVLPPKKVIIPVLVTVFLVPLPQQLYIAGVHLFVLRIIILCGLLRCLTVPKSGRASRLAGGWNSVDSAFSLYILFQAAATFISTPSSDAFVNQSGMILDFLGGYILLRVLIQVEADMATAIKSLALVAVVVATGMLIEQKNMLNIFGLLKGVSLVPEVRDGRIRSQGVFQHALTAGAFAAAAVPLFVLIWKNRSSRIVAIIGVVAATIMAFTTGTSTSVLSFFSGFLAMFSWPLRNRMRTVRWVFVGILAALSVVMKAPVWFIIAHIDVTGSSSSYQRALLVDQFIGRFWQWWLLGSNTNTWGWDMWDVQNQFVAVGAAGGLAALIAFILVISRSFSRLGNAMKSSKSVREQWVFWLLGAALFVHIVAFFGVNFFDQVRFIWCALIAMIIAVTVPSVAVSPAVSSATTAPRKLGSREKRPVQAIR